MLNGGSACFISILKIHSKDYETFVNRGEEWKRKIFHLSYDLLRTFIRIECVGYGVLE